jgi:hypothetical protein
LCPPRIAAGSEFNLCFEVVDFFGRQANGCGLFHIGHLLGLTGQSPRGDEQIGISKLFSFSYNEAFVLF